MLSVGSAFTVKLNGQDIKLDQMDQENQVAFETEAGASYEISVEEIESK